MLQIFVSPIFWYEEFNENDTFEFRTFYDKIWAVCTWARSGNTFTIAYPYIYIEWDYGALQSTKSPVLRVRISNLKVQTADPNRWTWSSYWNILRDQILYFFWIFFAIFKWVQSLLIQRFLHHPKLTILYLSKKQQKNSKKYKFWSPMIVQYEDHVQRIGSVVWTFKFKIQTRSTGGFVLREVP
jgi:hypothetical protein